LDDFLQPVPVGVAGELYIAGDGVTRGYWNNSELTAEFFVKDPFNINRETCMYRTGDRARYRRNGEIEFLGRTDHQVKIRGYRVELGEIEAVLIACPGIKECAVVHESRRWTTGDRAQLRSGAVHEIGASALTCAPPQGPTKEEGIILTPANQEQASEPESSADIGEYDAASGWRLVAYYATDVQVPSAAELRAFLEQKLPIYMIPSVLVPVGRIPLTPSGKRDYSALASVNFDGSEIISEKSAGPGTDIEVLMLQIWSDVLGVTNIGIHDNFFKLGGHSLLAMKIVLKVQQRLRKKVPVARIFAWPTVAQFCEGLAQSISRFPNVLPAIEQAPRNMPLALSLNQEALWTFEQEMPGTNLFSIPAVYQLVGALNERALEYTLQEICTRHEALRTVFGTNSDQPFQLIQQPVSRDLEVVDLREWSGKRLEELVVEQILRERETPFDLMTGPLFRTRLLRLTSEYHLLLATVHHLISDRWSLELFRADLSTLYEAFSQRRLNRLRAPRFQLVDYCVWEHGLLSNGYFSDHLKYWRAALREAIPKVILDGQRRDDNELSYRTSSAPVELTGYLWRDVRTLAHRQSCTPFMVFLSALNLVFYSLTGQSDICVAALAANRNGPETAEMIGCLANTVVLRTVVLPNASIEELIGAVKDATLSAFEFQELPFAMLAQDLELYQDRGINVIVNYQQKRDMASRIAGLTIVPLDLQQLQAHPELTISTCDLIFNLRETPDRLVGHVSYKRGLESSSSRIVVRLYAVLKMMSSHPNQKVSYMVRSLQDREETCG
jgi:hypothetical protein